MIGTVISHYSILEKLGGGGMGVVYKARDTLLDRAVALKVVSPDLVKDPAALNAFLREAKAASALNHPNILTVHDLVEAEGVRLIVMELVEGQTLRRAIPRKGLELKQLLAIAIQVGDALSAAHRSGIVHRDLKPENVMVRPDGHVKVVDFGLAKLLGRKKGFTEQGAVDSTMPMSALATAQADPSERSHLAGTLPYMSPEQFSGRAADQRSDIFSFGVVLYEAASGQQPFQGRTTGEIIESILRKEPKAISDVSHIVPYELQQIVSKCLEKDPADRYQHMEDVVVDLRRIKRVTESGRTLQTPVHQEPKSAVLARLKSNWSIVLGGVASLLLISAVVAVLFHYKKSPTAELAPVGKWGKSVGAASISPDGTHLAFESDATGQSEIYLMLATGGEARQLTEGEGDKHSPRFSPDGTRLLYSLVAATSEIWVIPTLGGKAQKLVSNANLADWSPDGKQIAYARSVTDEPASLWVADTSGHEARKVFSSHYEEIDKLRWSPDGQWIFLYPDEGPRVISPEGTKQKEILFRKGLAGDVAWSADSQYLLLSMRREGIRNIWKVRIIDGSLTKVTSGPGDDFDPMPLPGGGGLIFANGRPERKLLEVSPMKGSPREIIAGGWFGDPTISPDGRHIAYLEKEGEESTPGFLWVADMDGQNSTKITADANCSDVAWSPDSARLAFSVAAGPGKPKRYQIFTTALSEGTPNRVTQGDFDDYIADWSPDGESLLFVRVVEGKYDLMVHHLKTVKETLIGRGFADGQFSESGQWILAGGSSDRPGREGLWILPVQGGAETRVVSEAVGSGRWVLHEKAIVYSLMKKYKGKVAVWKQMVSNGKPVDSRALFYAFPASIDAESEWDVRNDLSALIYPRASSDASFYKLKSAD